MDVKLKICSFCGKPSRLWKANPKSCAICWQKNKPKTEDKTLNKSIAKRTESIKESSNYYKKAIAQNIINNKGKCLCDECKQPIKAPTGRNCCHIIGRGANEKLYHHPLNNFILGKGEMFGECSCGAKFDDMGLKSEMNIFKEYEHRRELLNNEFYTS